MDSADKLSHMESRVKNYLEERFPRGYTIKARREFTPCHLRFEVRSPDGRLGPTLVLPEEFADHEDDIERQLDARDVVGVMKKVARGTVIVPKVGLPVVHSGE